GAYRRPLADAEKDELRGLYRKLRAEEIPHEEAIRLTLARVLVAPAFLYRAEQPGPGDKPGPVNDWELATRLSYFLWSSAPDAEHTFLNEELAKHYGIPDSVFRGSRGGEAHLKRGTRNVERGTDQSLVTSTATTEGNGWHRVDGVKQFARGGILSQATTLAKQ